MGRSTVSIRTLVALLGTALVGLLVASLLSHPSAGHAASAHAEEGPAGRVALDGPWTVRGDRRERGMALGWYRGGFAGRTVQVPFSPNAVHVTGRRGIEEFRGSIAWYSTTFDVPEDGTYALAFGSVHHRAHVWVDGRSLGGHVGAYLPFEKRFHATAGTHTLVVRADYRGPAEMKRQGWHRTWFNFGGIAREVTLRELPDVDVLVPSVHTRLAADGSAVVDLSVHLHNLSGEPQDATVEGSLTHGDEDVDVTFPTVTVPAGRWRVARAQVTVSSPALWSPDTPNLYDLTLSVPGEGSWSGRTGLRELTWHDGRMFLNGQRLLLHGASLNEDAIGHGDALTPADMDELVAELKSIGANATRAQHALSPALLERLDAAGIMVWQEVGPVDAPGAWTSVTAAMQRTARRRVLTSVNQLQTHPSIIAWSLANEVAGHGHRGGQAQYIDAMARELHRRDPGRLIALDVWGSHPPKDDRSLIYRDIDMVGLTNYIGWYTDTRASRGAIAHLVRSSVGDFERAFSDKVVVISEFGAEASDRNPRLAPGGFGFQTRLLATHLRAYEADPRLSGMLIWVLRDFAVSPAFAGGSIHHQVPGIHIIRGINTKGLFTYAGRPKPAASMVREVFERLPTVDSR